MCICEPSGNTWQHELLKRARTNAERESKEREYQRECDQRTITILAYVPVAWRSIVCTCHDPRTLCAPADEKNQCGNCGKASRWLTAYCHGCHEYYYRGFDHHSLPVRREGISIGTNNTYGDGLGVEFGRRPDGNRARGHCWSCLVKKYGTMESDVPPPSWATPYVLDRQAFLAAEPVDPFGGLF